MKTAIRQWYLLRDGEYEQGREEFERMRRGLELLKDMSKTLDPESKLYKEIEDLTK